MSQAQAVRYNMVSGKAEESSSDDSLMLHPQTVFSNLQDEWQRFLSLVESELPWQTIQTWFLPIQPVFFIENNLFLKVPSRFFHEWLEAHHGPLLHRLIAEVFGQNARLEFLIATAAEIEAGNPDNREEGETGAAISIREEEVNQKNCDIDHRFRFENYFFEKEYQFAFKAAECVAKHLSNAEYNPLVIHGAIGTGKTHLLHAIGNAIQGIESAKRIMVISSERFLHEYIYALQNNYINKYMASLLAAEVFLLDDLHFLSNKVKSQEGILYVISELVKKGRQVVITANSAPNRLTQFNPHLISFLQKGLIVDLPDSEYATREKIVRYYLQKNEILLDEKIIHFLADTLNQNMHNLHAVMVRVVAQISLLGKGITLNDVRYIIAQMCPQDDMGIGAIPYRKEIGIDEIVTATANFFQLPPDILQGVSRKKRVIKARQIAIYMCREFTSESLNSIGYHFSNLHHASVLYAYKKVKKEMGNNPKLKASVQKIKALL